MLGDLKSGLCITIVCLAASAGCLRYSPRPLDPPRLERQYKSRDLSDPALRAFAEANANPKPLAWPPPSWDLNSLTLVAYYYSPEIAAARARYESARAAVLTARGKLNPSVSLGGGWTNSPESPLVLRFQPAITLETAGKRGYRILEAERQAEVSRLEASETAWKVRSAVRAAMLDHLLATAEVELLADELILRSSAVRILEQRLAAGEASRPELDLVRSEQASVEIATKNAEGRAMESKAQLAAAMGLPVTALQPIRLDTAPLQTPPSGVSLDAAQQAGLLNRPDVRRSLAEYAVAEAALQLEVAKQYPDVSLTPGYDFDEGHHKFTLGPELAIPLFNRNRGPIAQAEARRTQAAAQFLAVQARAIGDIEQARERYAAALAELNAAGAQVRFVRERREAPATRAVAAGEFDRLALTEAKLATSLAERGRLEAFRRALTALAAMEDAMAAGLPSLDPTAAAGPPAPGSPKKEQP